MSNLIRHAPARPELIEHWKILYTLANHLSIAVRTMATSPGSILERLLSVTPRLTPALADVGRLPGPLGLLLTRLHTVLTVRGGVPSALDVVDLIVIAQEQVEGALHAAERAVAER